MPCAVCSSSAITDLAHKRDYRFRRCSDCGFIFLDPMPSQETLNEQYIDPGTEAEPTYDKASSRMRRAVLKLPRFFPYAYKKDTLDLGCGGGFVAAVLALVARSSTGVDISRNAIDYARKRFHQPEFVCSNFADLLNMEKRFDFIYSSEVIEHVSDVNLYMQVLQRLIKPGGYVYITTPDSGHPAVPADISQWDVFAPPIHVQFFNRETATVLFTRYGFTIRKFYRNKKPGLIFLAQFDHAD
ncbi:MAG TPA: class I SAM-dependent methyltransferase [Gammaproteobacteria bacterium]|nr:class I SAM-dependent methyltransferase [Gammaproteobacteria bacterium]